MAALAQATRRALGIPAPPRQKVPDFVLPQRQEAKTATATGTETNTTNTEQKTQNAGQGEGKMEDLLIVLGEDGEEEEEFYDAKQRQSHPNTEL